MTDQVREELRDELGRVWLSYVRTTRDGLDAADLVETAPGVDIETAATAALEAFPGWAFSATPELSRVLLAGGATAIRHAHWMSRDLVADPPDPAWCEAEPADPALRVCPASLVPEDYLDATEAAYPPQHPDHEPRDSPADRVAKDVTPLFDGSYGRYLTQSAVVRTLAEDGSWGAIVAACIVVDRPGSGPWVVDVFRRPEPAFAGLGTLLLRRCMADLVASGMTRLDLAVTDDNSGARRAYERLGFTLVLESLTVRLPPAD